MDGDESNSNELLKKMYQLRNMAAITDREALIAAGGFLAGTFMGRPILRAAGLAGAVFYLGGPKALEGAQTLYEDFKKNRPR